MLLQYNHEVFPVSIKEKTINKLEAVSSVASLKGEKIDTITMYVNKGISDKMEKDIVNLRPRRVIFNPGAENQALTKNLERLGIEVIEACTLVMLRTNQF